MAETEQRLAEIEARANRLRHLAVTVHKEDDDRRVVGFEAKRHECAPSDLLRITSEALWLLTTLRAAEAREARLREALEAIKQATLDGRVCDDVAWFDTITTLHDYCELVLLGPDTRQSELPLQALEQKP